MSSTQMPTPIAMRSGDLAGKQLRIWTGTATTLADGTWSVDYSAAGFTIVPKVFTECFASGATKDNAYVSTLTAKNLVGAGGLVTKPNTATQTILTVNVLSGSTNANAGGVTIDVYAIGA